jgi:hypothetical protein
LYSAVVVAAPKLDNLLLLSMLCSSLEALDWDTSAAAAAAGGNKLEAGSCGTLGSTMLLQLLPPSVRLYQIVSPGLIGRAALFGCKLALPQNWRCIDPAYFDGEYSCCNYINDMFLTAYYAPSKCMPHRSCLLWW